MNIKEAHSGKPFDRVYSPVERYEAALKNISLFYSRIKGHPDFPSDMAEDFLCCDPDTGLYEAEVELGRAKYTIQALHKTDETTITSSLVVVRSVIDESKWVTIASAGHKSVKKREDGDVDGSITLNNSPTPQTSASIAQIPEMFPELYEVHNVIKPMPPNPPRGRTSI